MTEIPYGYCHCRCGNKTNIAKCTDKRYGHIKGEPFRYLPNHFKPNGPSRKQLPDGPYIRVFHPEHPRSTYGYVREHILIAEKALGKPLPPKAVVHHHTPEQLVVCQDNAYHNLLYARERALKACGHADWRKCWICKQYDAPNNLQITLNQSYHHDCYRAWRKEYCAMKKES